MIVASIMTGTSVDSVDISIVDLSTKSLLNFYSFDFTDDEKSYIESFLWPSNRNIAETAEFHFKFSKIVAKYFNTIPIENVKNVEYVVYHGQTIFHDTSSQNDHVPCTLQLGNGAMLCQSIKKNVITDLRSSDISLGQEGAPIVGFGDKRIFWKENKNIAIVNIGGISNVTHINKQGDINQFDLGPGNALIDAAMKHYFNKPFDDKGEIASKGEINDELSNLLRDDSFLKKLPPKSTGKEIYNLNYVHNTTKNISITPQDIITTLTAHTAYVISLLKTLLIDESDLQVVVAGGGTKNGYLLSQLKIHFPNIIISDEMGVPSQARESYAFAFFAEDYINNIKNGTGAKKSIFGCLYKI